MPADGISLPPKKGGTSARPAGPARRSGYINQATGRKGYDRLWHEADIKPRPLFGRFGVESGHHRLVMSVSAFDPKPDIGSHLFNYVRAQYN